MSVAKLHEVKKSMKDQGKCENCGEELPKGSAYRWYIIGFRSTYKHKRCTKATCFPLPSVRESSLFSSVLAAQEAFEDSIDELEDKDDIEAAVEEVASAVEELKNEYEDALELWPNGNEQLQEKVDHYDGQLDELQGWSFEGDDEPTLCEEHVEVGEAGEDCEECEQNKQEWIDEMREAAREVVSGIEQL